MLPPLSCGRTRLGSVRARVELHPATSSSDAMTLTVHPRLRGGPSAPVMPGLLPTDQDGELRGQCGKDLQRVLVPFSLVLVQQARWTTTAGRLLVAGQVLLSTMVACPSAQVVLG